MKAVKLNTTTINIYSSIKELPIDVRKRFDQYSIQDAGIGNSIADVDQHLEKVFTFVANDKKEDAMEELTNMRLGIFSALSGINFKSLSFACLVADNNDHSDEGLTNLVSRLSDDGLTDGMVTDILDEVKKNLIPNADFTSLNILERI
jgi:hypothetical protein